MKNIDRCDSAGPVMPDYTSIFSVTDQESPKHWGQPDFMLAAALTDENAYKSLDSFSLPLY